MTLRKKRVPLSFVFSVLFLSGFSVSLFSGDGARHVDPKANEPLKAWLVLAPIPVGQDPAAAPQETAQKSAFAKDYLADQGGESAASPKAGQKLTIDGKDLEWRLVESESANVNFVTGQAPTYSSAYAYAEIEVDAAKSVVLGLGSDDSVKVWLNGRMIHDNWIARALGEDQDVLTTRLEKGVNRVLVKVWNMTGDWAFRFRILGPDVVQKRFVRAASEGDLDQLAKLLEGGAPINGADTNGLNALQTARILGRREVADFLISKGADPSIKTPPVEEVIDRTIKANLKDGYPGVAVLAAKDGKVIYRKAFGLASVEHNVPFTPETKFRIGSVTKQFTAAAILKLQDEGKISVQDKLSKYIPDFPRGDEVTIHHLLTHTSGIHSYTNRPNFLAEAPDAHTTDELIKVIKGDPYDFNPGQRYLYNNSGFFLLGYIIEKVSGLSYPEYLRKTFFDPLGMKNTGVHNARDIFAGEASGYVWNDGKVQKALNWDMSNAGGAGALYSTVDDLFLWNEALFGGKVLGEASLKAAITRSTTVEDPDPNKDNGYGYGLALGKVRGLREVSHGGGLSGFHCNLLRIPDEHFTVAVLVNSAPNVPGLSAGVISNLIAELYLGDKMQERIAPRIDSSISSSSFDDYVGQYDYGMAVMTITRDGDRLLAQLGGQPVFQIFPKAKDVFFWKVVEAEVTFHRDATGKVVKALHTQSGQTITAPRIEAAAVAKVDSKSLDDFVGKYDYGQAGILTVTREGEHLFAQLAGQPKFEIFLKSDNEFFWKVVKAEVKFVRDSEGKVVRAVHSQGGGTIEAKRVE